ncbi:hypothetical protein [Streptomyces wuyuanensis]|uniref:hypothetical protein n=1 Tax=Streptomyces wuyuanensis TaxID=1196353 RepID=UPI0037B7DD44
MTDFDRRGPFSEWLWPRLGMQYASPLGWAAEIEQAAEATGVEPLDMFFDLLDEFRAARATTANQAVGSHVMPDGLVPGDG